ncbi:hypothetical protein GGQ03_002621 [Salinibacter ruber]|uniref:Uncharacterized protein n=1 Tax=Salinibacter ruber TaxID=146919 RepID=A0A9X2ZRF8_9BACT|nr:hypothetical protein [Salinibacter ruber]MCS4117933.1 hypothetical protein [Salinibacter ruber]MCS4155319.1 hypothetical protein [Salinibacter ruber]
MLCVLSIQHMIQTDRSMRQSTDRSMRQSNERH